MVKRSATFQLTRESGDVEEDVAVISESNQDDRTNRPVKKLPNRSPGKVTSPPSTPFSSLDSKASPFASFPTSGFPTSSFAFGASGEAKSSVTVDRAPKSQGSSGATDLTALYVSLRSLNVSLLNSVRSRLQKDPFTDLSTVLAQDLATYKSHRTAIEASRPKNTALSTAVAQSALSAPPAPPSSGFSFAGRVFGSAATSTPPSSLPTPTAGGVKFPEFKPPSTSLFGTTGPFAGLSGDAKSVPSSSSSDLSASKGLPSGSAQPAPAPFSFGSGAFAKPKAPASVEQPSVFPRGPVSFGSSMAPSKSADLEVNSSQQTMTGSESGPSLFASTDTVKESSQDTEGAQTQTGTVAANPFAAKSQTSPFSFGSKSAFGASPFSTSSPSPFGASKASSPAVGFSFGTSLFAPPAYQTGQALISADKLFTPSTDNTQSLVAPDEDSAEKFQAPTPSDLDAEGAGEEGEDTVFVQYGKLFRLHTPTEDGQTSEWKAVGVGNFKVKKNKESGRCRILFRLVPSGNLAANFNIFDAMKVQLADKTIVFPGTEDSKIVTYRLRMKTEAEAKQSQKALSDVVSLMRS